MTELPEISVSEIDLDALSEAEGTIAVIVGEDVKLDRVARRVNKLTKGALARFVDSKAFAKMKDGNTARLTWPAGLAAETVAVIRLDRRVTGKSARKAGAAVGKAANGKPVHLYAGNHKATDDLAMGVVLGLYKFTDHLSRKDDGEPRSPGAMTVHVSKPEDHAALKDNLAATAEGVFFTRDLVNAPSNILTTTSFADRLTELREMGVEVEVIDEDRMHELGMNTLLAVGQGSESPSKLVIMRWKGGGDAQPLALVGKGVVFDTGGISIKPAGGMEDMTMDMGGAGVVAGVMKTLAARGAKANVTGLVGIVENMPDGKAMRPGDVVTSMKGDTVEIINTDAEGRLVLCDVLWYAQEKENPAAIIDLATLTGAVIIALGHENAGVFSNDDDFAKHILAAAESEGEGAWRLPLGKPYAEQLKSRVADVKNVGGRPAGSITAAEFLRRFIKDDMPWAHIDIAGVASHSGGTDLSVKGATGWGVRTLDRLVRDRFEGD